MSASSLKVNVLGVGVSATSYSEVTGLCAGWVSRRTIEPQSPGRYVCVTSVHGIMEARRNSDIRSILNQADVVTPDGMPLVWALRSFGVTGQQRVYGPNLMLHLCEEAARSGHRIFLYGGRPETLEVLCRNLKNRFPGLNLAGRYSPPFRPLTAEEETTVCTMISDSRPDLLFVGISTPRQEMWMAGHRERFPGVVMIGVGAAFDFHAGRIRQAPDWMQKRGLEWFYRLSREPRRLWKRYVLTTPWFLPYWAMQKVGLVIHDFACGKPNREPESGGSVIYGRAAKGSPR